MKRACIMLFVLAATTPFLVGQDRRPGATPANPLNPSAPAVVGGVRPLLVDPQDFRAPLTEPQETLVPRYDDKLVRYTGTLVKWGEDKQRKTHWYELETVFTNLDKNAAPAAEKQPPGKRPTSAAKPKKESMVVKFYLQKDEPQLRSSQPGQLEVTVQGHGQILIGTWQLVIHDAVLVNVRPNTPPARPR